MRMIQKIWWLWAEAKWKRGWSVRRIAFWDPWMWIRLLKCKTAGQKFTLMKDYEGNWWEWWNEKNGV